MSHIMNFPSRSQRSYINPRCYLVLIPSIAVLCVFFYASTRPRVSTSIIENISALSRPSPPPQKDFRWPNIEPLRYLKYTPCFENYQCARLDVPMDWNSTSPNASRVSLALIRYPAPVSVLDHRYGGPILLNPGGPGGSGIHMVLRDAIEISTIVNPNTTTLFNSGYKYFDIISWDPRGVNNTTPHLNCFPSSFSLDVWNYQAEAEGIDTNSSTAISNMWARSKAIAAGCSSSEEIASHINTPPVVRDMVEIIERHGEWREKETKRLLANKQYHSLDLRAENRDLYSSEAIAKRTRWRRGEEHLNYWGFSYGTLLGATFAALQPHRVGRIILDGVVDATDYYHTTWLRNLLDTDAIMSKFYQYCTSAGPSNCSLAQTNSTPSSIESALESLLISLKEEPIAVSATATRGPEIVTYSDVMKNIRPALYNPFAIFPTMADLLSDLVYGNGSAFADSKQRSNKPRCPLQNQCDEALKEKCQVETGVEATWGILCSDGQDQNHLTKEDFKNIIGMLKEQSKWLGEYWAGIPMSCIHWKGKAKWKVTGDDIKGNTSHPILLIGNTLDPVTPVRNAHKMAKRFPGSVALEQGSEGHCSLSSPSICTAEHIRNYFQTGELPDPGTICQPDERPLIGNITDLSALSVDERVLLEALKRLAERTD